MTFTADDAYSLARSLNEKAGVPTVGRIVHFHAGHDIESKFGHGTEHIPSEYPADKPLAAIITDVEPDFNTLLAVKQALHPEKVTGLARLDVRYPGVQDPLPDYGPWYPYSETPKAGHWSWPPRG